MTNMNEKFSDAAKNLTLPELLLVIAALFSLWHCCADIDSSVYPTLFYSSLPNKSRFFVPVTIVALHLCLWLWAILREGFDLKKLSHCIWPLVVPLAYIILTTVTGLKVNSFWDLYLLVFSIGVSSYMVIKDFKKPFPLSWKSAWIIAILAVGSFVIWTAYFQEYALAGCLLNYADVGIYYERISNALEHGSFHQVHSDVPRFYFHFSPGLAIFIPIIYFFPSVSVLIIAQSLFMGITGLILFIIARTREAAPIKALAFCLCFLLYPAASQQTYNFACGFHPTTVALPLMLLSFFFLRRKNYVWGAVTALLAASMQEHVAIYFLGFGFFMLFSKKQVRCGISLAILSLVFFFAATKLAMPKDTGGSIHAVKLLYGHLGNSMLEVALSPFLRPEAFFKSFFAVDNLHLIICLFLPLMFSPFLRPYLLAGLIPVMAFNFMRTAPESKSIAMQYNTLSMAFIFYSFTMALTREKEDLDVPFSRFLEKIRARFSSQAFLGASLACCLTFSFFIGLFPWSKTANALPLSKEEMDKKREAVRDIETLIPLKSTVTSDNISRIMFVKHRLSIDPTERDIPTEYYVYQNPSNAQREQIYGPFIEKISKNKDYELIYNKNGFKVFKRKTLLPPLPENVF